MTSLRYIVPFLVLLLLPLCASAIWSEVPTSELITDTDYVVIASLSDVKEWSKNGVDYGHGTLLISEFLSNRRPDRNRIRLSWKNESGLVCPRVHHADTQGKEYIWLLNRTDDGTVTADYPGRVLDLKDKKKIVKLLKKNKT